MRFNPRTPILTRNKVELKGPVAKAIVETLIDASERMCLMNNGITILAKKVSFIKHPGGQGEVELTFSDPNQHGVPNGGHTLAAIFQVADSDERPDPWNAHVRLHIYEGIDPELIPSMAEGFKPIVTGR